MARSGGSFALLFCITAKKNKIVVISLYWNTAPLLDSGAVGELRNDMVVH